MLADAALPFKQKLPRGAPEPAAKRTKGSSKACVATAAAPAAAADALPVDASAPLLDLGELVPATLLQRPSATIRSPYVADVRLEDGSTALAWAPGMELGGVCVPGARLLLSRNAAPASPDAATKKTAFAIQLVAANEPECGATRPCWVGAAPLLGNRLVAAALRRGLLAGALGAHVAVRAEATHGNMRVDFELTHEAGETSLVEVKSVVCSDYAVDSAAPRPKGYDLVRAAPGATARTAVFPVGKRGQKLADGTLVVSERAIKHVRELAHLAARPNTKAALLFVVNRGDCASVALRNSSCAVFGAEAAAAAAAGVALLAFRVRWQGGAAFWDGALPVSV